MEIRAKCKYDLDSVKALTHLTMYKKADPKKKIKALKEELTRLNNVYTKGRMTEANYDLEYDRIEKEIKQYS